MKTVALILAAGPYRRGWKEQRPKQLALIENQPLILRTLGQLQERGLDDVVVITHNKKIKEATPRHFEPKANRWWTETLLSTQELWSDRTMIVNGDTVYSNEAMNMLAEESRPLTFIGDMAKVHVELLVFTKDRHDLVVHAAEVATAEAERRQAEPLDKRWKTAHMQGFMAMHWAFYGTLAGLPIVYPAKRMYSPKIHRLLSRGDYTFDVDSVVLYERFLVRNPWAR